MDVSKILILEHTTIALSLWFYSYEHFSNIFAGEAMIWTRESMVKSRQRVSNLEIRITSFWIDNQRLWNFASEIE